jgi:vanillate O-demethylase monooxygenase subunit
MVYLRNAWYVAAWAEALAPGQIISRTICDEPIAIYRRRDGSVAALSDRCPHRFAPLSLGRVCEDTDHVECPYHGLRFDDTGACVVNPHGSGRIPRSLAVTSYPVVHQHTLLWVWMGDAEPDPKLIPDFSYLDPGAPGIASARDWITMDVDYRLVVDNLLDLSHAAVLHRGVLGNDESLDVVVEIVEGADSGHGDGSDTLYVNRTNSAITPPAMFDLMFRADGLPVDMFSEMRWDPPAHLRHDAGVTAPGRPRAEGLTIRGTHIVTPSTTGSCYYHFAAVRIAAAPSPADHDDALAQRLSEMRRFAFNEQDKPILEAQQRAYDRAGGPDALRPVMLSIDAAPIRARRILDRLIAAERDADFDASGGAFDEPLAGVALDRDSLQVISVECG